MPKEVHRSPFVNLVGGGIAGCIAKTAVAPLDRVKILLQGGVVPKGLSLPQTLRFIYQRDGFFGFYKGHSMTLLRIFPYAGVQFSAYHLLRRLLPNSPLGIWVSGATAGAIAVSLTYPLDFLRARLAFSSSPLSALLLVVRSERARFPTFQGYFATLLGILPYAGTSFLFFQWSRQRVNSDFLSGLFAGAVGQTVAYPLDLVRRRIQLNSEVAGGFKYSGGIWQSLRFVHRRDGVRGLFRGLSLNYLRAAPASAISFFCYYRIASLLGEVSN